jgi:hypothetical protein
MTTLPDEEIQTIAKDIATANSIPVQAVSTSPVMDSAGLVAVEVIISIPPGSLLRSWAVRLRALFLRLFSGWLMLVRSVFLLFSLGKRVVHPDPDRLFEQADSEI